MNHYMVTIQIQIGGIQKTAQTLVKAPDREKARLNALAHETHDDNAEFDGRAVTDRGGEMIYTVKETKAIPDDYLPVLATYQPIIDYSVDYINQRLAMAII